MTAKRSDSFTPSTEYPGTWINRSTGIEIVKIVDNSAGVQSVGYRVQASNGLRITSTGTLATARVAGKEQVAQVWAARDEAHAEALAEQEKRDLAYARRQFPSVFAMLDEQEGIEPEPTPTTPVEARIVDLPPVREFDPERGATAPDANRHASQTGGVEPTRVPAPQLLSGRPAGWGDAWLEVNHPAKIDLVYGPGALDTYRYLTAPGFELSAPGPY